VVGFRSRHCPRGQTLNEDNTLNLHVTPPLRKHFVAGCAAILQSVIVCPAFGSRVICRFGETEHTLLQALVSRGLCGL